LTEDLTYYSLKLQDYFSDPEQAKKSKGEAQKVKEEMTNNYHGNA